MGSATKGLLLLPFLEVFIIKGRCVTIDNNIIYITGQEEAKKDWSGPMNVWEYRSRKARPN